LKKILSLFLAVAMMASLVLPLSSCSSGPSIVVCNWGEYMSTGSDADYDIIKEFEKATGIEVKYVTAESNETLYSQMKSGAGKYDVIFPYDKSAEQVEIARKVYEALGAKDNIEHYVGEEGHRYYPDIAWPAINKYICFIQKTHKI